MHGFWNHLLTMSIKCVWVHHSCVLGAVDHQGHFLSGVQRLLPFFCQLPVGTLFISVKKILGLTSSLSQTLPEGIFMPGVNKYDINIATDFGYFDNYWCLPFLYPITNIELVIFWLRGSYGCVQHCPAHCTTWLVNHAQTDAEPIRNWGCLRWGGWGR